MRPRPRIFFGPPGTGKTERIIRLLAEEVKAGLSPEEIMVVSFSKAAVHELQTRAGLPPSAIPWMRTIHSIGFRLCDISREQVVTGPRLHEFAKVIGEPLSRQDHVGLMPTEIRTDLGTALQIGNQARARETPFEVEYARWGLESRISLRRAQALWARYATWKSGSDSWDFADMIAQADGQVPVKLVIVDEAQDTTPASWSMLRRIIPQEARIVLAGDDDQTIYGFAGADGTQLLRFEAEREVLPQSYRLARRIKAEADLISQRIRVRYPKEYAPRDAEGMVRDILDLNQIEIGQGEESWLLLARSGYQLSEYIRYCEERGLVYSVNGGPWSWDRDEVRAALAFERLRAGKTVRRVDYRRLVPYLVQAVPAGELQETVTWDDVFRDERFKGLRELPWHKALSLPPAVTSYVKRGRRRGESFTQPGRVRISTIHRAKGAEADQVVLLRAMPKAPHASLTRASQSHQDAERRAWYVGVTRAKHQLTWVSRGTRQFRG